MENVMTVRLRKIARLTTDLGEAKVVEKPASGFDQLQRQIGDLDDLQTDAKGNLVAAINEAAASGGGTGGQSAGADWSQNDPAGAGYVQHRPGGYDVPGWAQFYDGTIPATDQDEGMSQIGEQIPADAAASIKVGDEIRVTIDGVATVYTARGETISEMAAITFGPNTYADLMDYASSGEAIPSNYMVCIIITGEGAASLICAFGADYGASDSSEPFKLKTIKIEMPAATPVKIAQKYLDLTGTAKTLNLRVQEDDGGNFYFSCIDADGNPYYADDIVKAYNNDMVITLRTTPSWDEIHDRFSGVYAGIVANAKASNGKTYYNCAIFDDGVNCIAVPQAEAGNVFTYKKIDYLTADTLQDATDAALAQAKASGAFDGADGAPGTDGKDGITPTIGDNGNWYLGTTDTGNPSRGPQGNPGKDGAGLDITSATVGQIAKISAVDDNGVPTAWEPTDMASGGALQWVEVADIVTDTDVQSLSISTDKDGRAISGYNALAMILSVFFPADGTQTSTTGAPWIYPFKGSGDNSMRTIASVIGWKSTSRALTFMFMGTNRAIFSSSSNSGDFFSSNVVRVFDGAYIFVHTSGDHIPAGTKCRIVLLTGGWSD